MAYSKAQYKKIYQTLPEALKEALGSVEIQDEIDEICRENGVTDDSVIDKVYNLVMDVFMGLVHPDNFETGLTQVLQGQESASREIAHRIRRFVIFPLKAEIAQLHRIEISRVPTSVSRATKMPIEEGYVEETEEQREERRQEKEIFSEEERRQDMYREQTE